MNYMDILKNALETRKMTRSALAEKLGYKRPSSVSNILTGVRVPAFDNYVKMLNAAGFDVIVRDQYDKKTEWVVDAE